MSLLNYRSRFSEPIFTYQLYQVVRYMVSLLVSVVLVKSALPQTDLGYFEMILFIVASVSIAWSAGLNNGLFSIYNTLSDEKKRIVPFTYVILLVVLSGIIALLIYVFSKPILLLFSSYEALPGWTYAPVYLFFTVPLIAIEGLLFLKQNSRQLLIYTLWSQCGLLLLVLVVARFQPDVLTFIQALIFWSFIRWIYMFFVLGYSSLRSFDFSMAIHLLKYSLPLMLALFVGYGMDMIDGLFVGHFFEASYFPVFKYGAREMPLSSLLLSSLSVAMIPALTQSSMQESDILKRTTRLMHILYPLSYVLMVASPYIFPIIYSEAYRDSAYIFNIYLLILMSRILLPQSYTMAQQKHQVILVSGVLELIINGVLSYLLLNVWGIYGLAWATVIAYFFQKIYLMIYNKRQFNIPYSTYIHWKYYTIYNVILVILLAITFYFRS